MLDDFAVRSVKTGMLATAAIVTAVADLAARGLLPQLVVDPVLVSSTGHRLLEPDGVAAYLELLLPHALVATPNLREAAVLGDTDVESLGTLEARMAVAERIRATGARYVVVKGGHLTESADDVVAGPEGVVRAARRAGGHRQRPRHRLLALRGRRRPPGPGAPPCPRRSRRPRRSWRGRWPGAPAWRLGAGHGPLDHFGWSGPP